MSHIIDLTDRKRPVKAGRLVKIQSDHAAENDGNRRLTFIVRPDQAAELYTEIAERYEAQPDLPRVGFWTRWDALEFEIQGDA